MPTSIPANFTHEETRLLASRQLLSFLSVPKGSDEEISVGATKGRFSVGWLPRAAHTVAPELFRWTTRTIYDVDDRELFHDHTLSLDSENEIRVRTAANRLLWTPVWSVSAGKPYIEEAYVEKTRAFIESSDYELVMFDGETEPRIVCYSYPKVGLVCQTRTEPKERFIADLTDRIFIPLDQQEKMDFPSTQALWSPYDIATRATKGYLSWMWTRKMASLRTWDVSHRNLKRAIARARESTQIVTTDPSLKLESQQNDHYCAPATASMILTWYKRPFSQYDIAKKMGTSPIKGSHLEKQESAIAELTDGALIGVLDDDESFEKAQYEIAQHKRPFRTGTAADHARACGGYKLEEGANWLQIYDPYPSNEGRVYFEAWNPEIHKTFMYIKYA